MVAPFQFLCDFGEGGAAHGVCGSGEEGLDLGVIKLGAFVGEPAAGLVVEVLEVIVGIAVGVPVQELA